MAVTRRTLDSGATTWVASWRDGAGNLKRRHFPTKAAAKEHETDMLARRNRGEYVNLTGARKPLHYWWTLHQESRDIRPSSETRQDGLWKTHISPRFGTIPVGQISHDSVQDWLNQMDRSPSTKAQARILLKQLIDQAIRAKAITDNPVTHVPQPKTVKSEKRFLNADEIAELEAAAPHPWAADLINLCVFTGMRQGEWFGLRRRDVDMAARMIHVTQSATTVSGAVVVGPPKSAKPRSIALSAARAEVLERQLARHDHELVFPSTVGTHLRGTNFRRNIWLPTLKAADKARGGLHYERTPGCNCGTRHTCGVRFHDLRHTMVAWRIRAGESAKKIQDVCGHASIETTFGIYGHLFPEDKAADAERLESSFSN